MCDENYFAALHCRPCPQMGADGGPTYYLGIAIPNPVGFWPDWSGADTPLTVSLRRRQPFPMHIASLSAAIAAIIYPIASRVLSDSIHIRRGRLAVPHVDTCETAVNFSSFRALGEYLWIYIFF